MHEHLIEEWREIPGFPGNEASTLGDLRTYWYRVRNAKGRGFHREFSDVPRPISMSLNGGYLHSNIYCDIDKRRYTRKVHGLVGRTFLPLPDDFDEVDYTIDHIRPGAESKLDNRITNLQWLPRADNIKKAYADGVCDDRIRRQRRPVMVTDLWDGTERYFDSIGDAAYDIGVHYTTISHAIHDGEHRVSHYIVDFADREDILLYGSNDCYDY